MDVLPGFTIHRDSTSPLLISDWLMDSVVAQTKPDTKHPFDTARITAAIDALAEQHAGREDVFRAAITQLLKSELAAARAAAQAQLLKDRHGRRCAEQLCHVQDEIIRILFS